jgi:AhpD family alkylhydroperoxidase
MVERMIRGAYEQSILPADERELARMRIAQINDCVACSDFRARSVLDAGLPAELYDNVAAYSGYPGYTPRQRLAIEYAERFATDHASMDDAFFERVRELFSDEEILDLTLCIGVFLGLGRSLTVLGVDQSCAIDL